MPMGRQHIGREAIHCAGVRARESGTNPCGRTQVLRAWFPELLVTGRAERRALQRPLPRVRARAVGVRLWCCSSAAPSSCALVRAPVDRDRPGLRRTPTGRAGRRGEGACGSRACLSCEGTRWYLGAGAFELRSEALASARQTLPKCYVADAQRLGGLRAVELGDAHQEQHLAIALAEGFEGRFELVGFAARCKAARGGFDVAPPGQKSAEVDDLGTAVAQIFATRDRGEPGAEVGILV